jgi:NAD(P)-dependent dehydrogenase (short-subunit alcohol dehydrogenase family)
MQNQANQNGKAFIVTGPTSGIGRASALALAKHGTVVLVGRDRAKLAAVCDVIERQGGSAVAVVCDLSDLASARRAAAEIAALRLPLAGLLNNAGIMSMNDAKNARGWDMSFLTNHLGPFAFTEALLPHLPDGASVLFVASAVEDPERKPAVAAGFRGSRYVSAEASLRGRWKEGGSTRPGFDAYATSKQCTLAAAMVLAREAPRLRINAVEPGLNPGTSLGLREANAVVRVLAKIIIPVLVPLLMPFVKILSTPKRAARVITAILTDGSGRSGIYFDEGGQSMQASLRMRDPQYAARIVTETRALLATMPV